jgi:hypothetical protein
LELTQKSEVPSETRSVGVTWIPDAMLVAPAPPSGDWIPASGDDAVALGRGDSLAVPPRQATTRSAPASATTLRIKRWMLRTLSA